MKKIADIMKEIGFNKHGSDAVKEAFVKNLIKQSYGINVQTPSEKKIIADHPGKIVAMIASEKYSLPTQLAFVFEESPQNSSRKKAV